MKSVRKVIILEQPTVSDESVDNCLCFIDNHSHNRYLQNIYYVHGSFLNIMIKTKCPALTFHEGQLSVNLNIHTLRK